MEYPQELLEEFEGTPGGYSWISAKNPALLDYRGAEFILIGANSDLGAHLTWIFPVPSVSRALISEAGNFVGQNLLP